MDWRKIIRPQQAILLLTPVIVPFLLLILGFSFNFDIDIDIAVFFAFVQLQLVYLMISRFLAPYTTFRLHIRTLTLYMPFTTGILYLILYYFVYEERLMVWIYFLMMIPTIVLLEPQYDSNERYLRWTILLAHFSGYLPFMRLYRGWDRDLGILVQSIMAIGPMVVCGAALLQLLKQMDIIEAHADADLLWTTAEHHDH